MLFQNQQSAGKQLGKKLQQMLRPNEKAMVISLPKGSAAIGHEVSMILRTPHYIGVTVPLEDASGTLIGAIAGEDTLVFNDPEQAMTLDDSSLETLTDQASHTLMQIQEAYPEIPSPQAVRGNTIILVSEGIASGICLRALIALIRPWQPKRIIIAAPVGTFHAVQQLRQEVEEVLCLKQPLTLKHPGVWFCDYHNWSDGEAASLVQSDRLSIRQVS